MTEPMTLEAASAAMRAAMRETIKRHAIWYLIQAAMMILAGLAALAYPLLSSAALVIFLGWTLIIAGAVQGIGLIGATQVPNFWLQLISVVLAVIMGVLFLRNPAAGIETLALLVIMFFMVQGMSKVVFALTIRPLANWGWVLGSGLLGMMLAIYMLSNPTLSILVLGLLIGLQLIAEGAALGWLAWQARNSG